MYVSADRSRCTGSAQCVLTVPDVFDQDNDGMVTVVESSPGTELHEAVREAAHVCPVAAITFREG